MREYNKIMVCCWDKKMVAAGNPFFFKSAGEDFPDEFLTGSLTDAKRRLKLPLSEYKGEVEGSAFLKVQRGVTSARTSSLLSEVNSQFRELKKGTNQRPAMLPDDAYDELLKMHRSKVNYTVTGCYQIFLFSPFRIHNVLRYIKLK